jgi:hypothetical protein
MLVEFIIINPESISLIENSVETLEQFSTNVKIE